MIHMLELKKNKFKFSGEVELSLTVHIQAEFSFPHNYQ